MSMVYVNGLDDIVLLLTEWLMILGGVIGFCHERWTKAGKWAKQLI